MFVNINTVKQNKKSTKVQLQELSSKRVALSSTILILPELKKNLCWKNVSITDYLQNLCKQKVKFDAKICCCCCHAKHYKKKMSTSVPDRINRPKIPFWFILWMWEQAEGYCMIKVWVSFLSEKGGRKRLHSWGRENGEPQTSFIWIPQKCFW